MALRVSSGMIRVGFSDQDQLMSSFVELSAGIVHEYVNSDPSDRECCLKVSAQKIVHGDTQALYSSRFIVDKTDKTLIHVKDFMPKFGHDYFIKSEYRVLPEHDYMRFPVVTTNANFYTDDDVSGLVNKVKNLDPSSTIILSPNPSLIKAQFPGFRVYQPIPYLLLSRDTAKNLVVFGYKRFVRPLLLFCAAFSKCDVGLLIPDDCPPGCEQKSWSKCTYDPVVLPDYVEDAADEDFEEIGVEVSDEPFSHVVSDNEITKMDDISDNGVDSSVPDSESPVIMPQFVTVRLPGLSADAIVNNPAVLSKSRNFLGSVSPNFDKRPHVTRSDNLGGRGGVMHVNSVQRVSALSYSGIQKLIPPPGFSDWFGDRGGNQLLDVKYIRLIKSLNVEFVKDGVIGVTPFWTINKLIPTEETLMVDDVMMFLYLLGSYNDNPKLLPGPPSLMCKFMGYHKLIKSDRSRIRAFYGFDIHDSFCDGYGYLCSDGRMLGYHLSTSCFYPFNTVLGGFDMQYRETKLFGEIDRSGDCE